MLSRSKNQEIGINCICTAGINHGVNEQALVAEMQAARMRFIALQAENISDICALQSRPEMKWWSSRPASAFYVAFMQIYFGESENLGGNVGQRPRRRLLSARISGIWRPFRQQASSKMRPLPCCAIKYRNNNRRSAEHSIGRHHQALKYARSSANYARVGRRQNRSKPSHSASILRGVLFAPYIREISYWRHGMRKNVISVFSRNLVAGKRVKPSPKPDVAARPAKSMRHRQCGAKSAARQNGSAHAAHFSNRHGKRLPHVAVGELNARVERQ